MKKTLLAVMMLVGLTQVNAEDKLGVGAAFDGSVGLTAQYSADFGTINGYVNLIANGMSVGADYIIQQQPIDAVAGLSWYYAGGLGLAFSGTSVTSGSTTVTTSALGIAPRVPVGVDYNINEQIDVIFEIVPTLTYATATASSGTISASATTITFGVGYNLALRYFF